MNIIKNWHLKLLAFFAALLLWLFVVGVENYVFTSPVDLAVKITNLGQNFSITEELPHVRVKYKSREGNININPNELELFINAQGLADGTFNLPIEFTNKSPHFTVVAIEPSNIDLKLEAITSKEINISLGTLGTPDKNYEVKDLQADQTVIKLSGPASVINGITELPIKVALDGTETADFSRKITLEPPVDWNVGEQSISFDPATIQADISIRKKQVLPETPIGTDNNNSTIVAPGTDAPVAEGMARKTLMVEIVPADDIRSSIKELVPKNILVTVEAAPAALANLNNSSIKLVMSTSEVQNGSYTVSLKDLVLPEGQDLKVITLSPNKVTVKF